MLLLHVEVHMERENGMVSDCLVISNMMNLNKEIVKRFRHLPLLH
jgi:hypothetical protein